MGKLPRPVFSRALDDGAIGLQPVVSRGLSAWIWIWTPPVWNATVFTNHQDRLVDGEVATAFSEDVLRMRKVK